MKLKNISIVIICLIVLFVGGIIIKTQFYDNARKNISSSESNYQENNLNIGQFSAKTLDGDTITNDFFSKEKLTLINVWATFCNPCKMEMPGLGKLDQEMDDVQIMGVVMDVLDQDGQINQSMVETASSLKKASNVKYPSAIINQNLVNLGLGSITSLPTTIFVDSKGNIIGDLVIGARDEIEWREIIKQRLEALK